MRTIDRVLLLACCAFVLVACGGDEGDEEELPDVNCDEGTIPTYDEVTALDKCVTCHSTEKTGAARNDAPTEDNFNTYAGASREPEEMAHEVFEGEMPPPGTVTITDAEKQALYKWALCGAPE